MLLADTIKKTREEKGITPEMIPGLMQISLREYKSIESGVAYPTLNCLLRMKEVFGVSLPYLLTGEEKYHNKKMLHLKLTKDNCFYLWFYKWIHLKSNDICFQQIVAYCSLSKRILTEFGEESLDDISSSMIKEFLNEFKDILSKRTIIVMKSVIKQVYDFAIYDRQYAFNPAIYCSVPKDAQRTPETKIISKNSMNSILSLEHEMQPAAVVMMLAGLRRGEMMALRWNDINFEEKYIEVNKAIEIVHGASVLKDTTKTESGMRRVDMAQVLIDSLINYRQSHPEIKDTDLILKSEHGEYCATKAFYRRWDEYILDLSEKAGLKEYFTSKQLRHYFASLCYMSGIDVKSTSKLMGHSSPEITLRIYIHLDNLFKRVKLTKLDEYIA